MKNKLNKILLITSTILVIVILILALFASINREGYLSNFQLNKDLSKKNAYYYDFRLKYYSKIFRNSDIYGVVFDIPQFAYVGKNLIEFKNITFDKKGSSPFGNFISTRELRYDDKIQSINYKLKLKPYIIIIALLAFIYILFNYKFISNIFKDRKELITKISKVSSISILALFVLLFILGKLNHKASLEDLELVAESEAGYVYKARVVGKGLFADNVIYKYNSKLQLKNKPDYIKNYGYNLNLKLKNHKSKNGSIYNNPDKTVTISNDNNYYSVLVYDIEPSVGEKYIFTLEAKKIGDVSGNIRYQLDDINYDIVVPNTDKMTDEYKEYISTLNIKDAKKSVKPVMRVFYPLGTINVKSLNIKQVSDNLYLKSGNSIIFTSSEKIDNVNDIDSLYYTLSFKLSKIEIIILLFFVLFFCIAYSYKHNIFIFNKNIDIKLSVIIIMGYLYLIIPFIIFIIGWTKYIISIPVSIGIFIIIYIMIKETIQNCKETIRVNLITFISLLILIVCIVIIAGQGEIFQQAGDNIRGRNPLFRDLVNFSWPVIYPETGYGVVYYLGHWLVPSVFGKLFGFDTAKIVLIFWSSLGIFIAFTLMMIYLRVKNNFFIIIALIIFLTFNSFNNLRTLNVHFGYADIFGAIVGLYNQYIPTWVMCSLFLNEKKSSNFAFLGLSIILYSSYAILAITPFMIIKAILDYKKYGISEIKNIFSIRNIVASMLIFPIMYFYISSNNTLNEYGFEFISFNSSLIIFIYMAIIRFGVFLFFIYKDNKKNYIFYVSLFVFLIVPMIQYGIDHNFYRTNAVPYFFTITLILKYLYDNFYNYSVKKILLILILVFASSSRIVHIDSRISNFIKNDFKATKDVGSPTLNVKENNWIIQTMTCQDMDNSIFFKYIAKDKKQ